MRNTTIKLYKGVPLEYNNENTFYFSNVFAQSTYFASKLWRTITGTPLHREGVNSVRINCNISQCFDVDYISFINTDHQNKLYYCFVTHVNYISETVSEIVYQVDYVQTWLFETTNNMLNCFIERNTVAHDNGTNRIKESFDLGTYVTNFGSLYHISELNDLVIVVQASFDVKYWIEHNYSENYKRLPTPILRNGVLDTSDLVYFDVGTGTTAFNVVMAHVDDGTSGVTIDDFFGMWLYPKNLLSGTEGVIVGATEPANKMYYSVAPSGFNVSPSLYLQSFNDGTGSTWTPKNKKLLQSPFMNIYVSNNNGNAVNYAPEYFNTVAFRLFGNTSADGKARLTPLNYKGLPTGITALSFDTDESIDSAPFPSVPLLSDSYLVWLTQNRHSVDNKFDEMHLNNYMNTVNGALGMATSAQSLGLSMNNAQKEGIALSGSSANGLLGAGMSMINSGVASFNNIRSMIAQTEDAKIRPATAKGAQSEGLAFQWGKHDFTLCVKCIDIEHAKSIDDFYTMYGYPIKHVETPSINNRTRFTYIKCVGFKTNGAIPQDERETVENYFNNGIRFWNDRTNFGDFSIANAEYS